MSFLKEDASAHSIYSLPFVTILMHTGFLKIAQITLQLFYGSHVYCLSPSIWYLLQEI